MDCHLTHLLAYLQKNVLMRFTNNQMRLIPFLIGSTTAYYHYIILIIPKGIH